LRSRDKYYWLDRVQASWNVRAIFPNATHMIPFDDPATFNATVERFIRTPFVKKDRIKETMASLEKLRASQQAETSQPAQAR
jgi:hypothetical protein